MARMTNKNEAPRMPDLIPKHGGYRKLKSFQVAQLVYDVTVRFCDRYIDKFSRTKDQMIQAARSGTQNIAEGSQASATSKKMEIKLTQVARASLEELKLDYEDFLRQRNLRVWGREEPLRQDLIDRRCRTADEVAQWIVDVGGRGGRSGRGGLSGRGGRGGRRLKDRGKSDKPTMSARPTRPAMATESTVSTASAVSTGSTRSTASTQSTGDYPEHSANAALALIAVACSLLERQVNRLAQDFENKGGFTERLYRVRSTKRRNNK